MVRPSNRSYSNITRSILPPALFMGCGVVGRKTSCDDLANKKIGLRFVAEAVIIWSPQSTFLPIHKTIRTYLSLGVRIKVLENIVHQGSW